jgi:alkylation response protein AidB-like acyl-CoA dehydrogenase
MDFSLTEDQRAIQDMAENFATAELAPHALHWDETKTFPIPTLRDAAALGLGAIYAAEEFGGTGLKRLDAVLIFEALSKACPSVAAYISIHNMCTWMIDRYGNDEQRARYIPKLASMDYLASYCLTEPNAGSDAGNLRTKAVRDNDDYVITGEKQFISGAGATDIYVVMARTADTGPRGISAFIIERDTPGLSFGANEKKMGWNAQPTRAVLLDNVRVPTSQLLGTLNKGFNIAMSGLDGGRLNISACSLGGAQSAFDKAVAYMNQRKAFGQRLQDFQALQFRLAEMATNLEAVRLFLWRAASALDAKSPDATRLCAMAKLFVTDKCFDIANQALQLHGGYGYLADYGIEKIVRDLRVHQILEGTNEIMRVIIARGIFAES